MMQSGILEEAKLVYDHRDTYRTAAQAIGYKEFFPYFEGTADLESCLAQMCIRDRDNAARQCSGTVQPPAACGCTGPAAAAAKAFQHPFRGRVPRIE